MKKTMILAIAICMFTIGMARPIDDTHKNCGLKYENELLSIQLPLTWGYDESGWKGLDSVTNVVDFKDLAYKSPAMIHIVKTMMPFQYKNVNEAADIAKAARAMSKDDTYLYAEDSTTLDGRPSHINVYAIFHDKDTTVQQQYVIYLEESHITMYVNAFCPFSEHINDDMEFVDKIIETIRFKKVKNPLDDETILQKLINEMAEKKKSNIPPKK